MITATDPTPERRQHDRVTRAVETLADTDGHIGLPWRVETMLARLERNGDIGPGERAAGEEFARLFQIANLDPLRARNLLRGERAQGALPHGSDRARRQVMAALDALGGIGSPCGSAVWFIVGTELSVREWAMREGWSGRPISREVAKGALIGGLGVLAGHFRA